MSCGVILQHFRALWWQAGGWLRPGTGVGHWGWQCCSLSSEPQVRGQQKLCHWLKCKITCTLADGKELSGAFSSEMRFSKETVGCVENEPRVWCPGGGLEGPHVVPQSAVRSGATWLLFSVFRGWCYASKYSGAAHGLKETLFLLKAAEDIQAIWSS